MGSSWMCTRTIPNTFYITLLLCIATIGFTFRSRPTTLMLLLLISTLFFFFIVIEILNQVLTVFFGDGSLHELSSGFLIFLQLVHFVKIPTLEAFGLNLLWKQCPHKSNALSHFPSLNSQSPPLYYLIWIVVSTSCNCLNPHVPLSAFIALDC